MITVTLLAGVLAAVSEPGLAAAATARPVASVPISAPRDTQVTRAAERPRPRATAVSCPDVYFLGARGSGEKGTSKFQGMGPEVAKMATVAENVLKADHVTTFKTLADVYPADNVTDLVPTAASGRAAARRQPRHWRARPDRRDAAARRWRPGQAHGRERIRHLQERRSGHPHLSWQEQRPGRARPCYDGSGGDEAGELRSLRAHECQEHGGCL